MKNKQIFFIALLLIITYIHSLKLKKNIKKGDNQGINNNNQNLNNNSANKNQKQKQIELNQLSKNLDGMIKEAKKEMSLFIKDAIKDAKREIKEEKKNYK